jgi:hypothetical protein
VETGFPSGQTQSVCPEIMLKQKDLAISGGPVRKNKALSFLSRRQQSAHIRQVVQDSGSVLARPILSDPQHYSSGAIVMFEGFRP